MMLRTAGAQCPGQTLIMRGRACGAIDTALFGPPQASATTSSRQGLCQAFLADLDSSPSGDVSGVK